MAFLLLRPELPPSETGHMPEVFDMGEPDSSVNSAQVRVRFFAAHDDARYPRFSLIVSVIPPVTFFHICRRDWPPAAPASSPLEPSGWV